MNVKRFIFSMLLAFIFAGSSTADNSQTKDYAQYVNQWIGTGGHGHVFLGANIPFGFVQLGPTQYSRGWDWCSGYHISDSLLVGFSHMHLSGTGIGDLGDIALLPVASVGQRDVFFSHDNEVVSPGYYSVKLNCPNVLVELTATKRVGMHRYTFGGNCTEGFLRLNLKQGIGWDNVRESKMIQESETVISGYRRSMGWARDQMVYFVAEFSSPVTIEKQEGDTISVLRVTDISSPLVVKVALSPVSVDNAKLNLQTELPGWQFAKTAANARKAWNDELSKVSIDTDDLRKKHIFYTALYHTMVAPSVFCDVNGDYRGADNKVYNGNFTNYTTFSLWDTYRAAHPLMTLIHPEKQADMAATFINICRQQGKLPVWHLMGNETDCMVGNPGVAVLADMVLKGFVSDKQLAYEALRTSALCNDRGLNLLKEYGYLPYDKDSTYETVAKGLEYAIADDGVAKVAKLLGKKEDYRYFRNRSKAYKKYFDKSTGFMRGVGSDGKFREPFDPFNAIHRQDDYTEGNAWQYAWLVPHDVHGLVDLFDSEESFTAKFDSLFIVSGDLGTEASPDISGLIGQYAHGNEPSHHILYMYNYIGQPYKAAPLLRQVMNELYFDNFDGLSGNEDVGQMSAWYVLSSVGLYQVEPAGGKYIIGSPLFNKTTLNVGSNKSFTIVAHSNSETNIYVQSAKLNGKPYNKSYLMFNDIKKGGILELEMGCNPSKWGTKKNERP